MVIVLDMGTEVKQYVVYVLEGTGSCSFVYLERTNKTTENVSHTRKHQTRLLISQ
jgi:LPS sulfotransferase NodH